MIHDFFKMGRFVPAVAQAHADAVARSGPHSAPGHTPGRGTNRARIQRRFCSDLQHKETSSNATPPIHRPRGPRRRHRRAWARRHARASRTAEKFPQRPIRLVIGYTAGGSTDIPFRVLADNASKILGQPVIVENKPGAGGVLPAQMMQSTAPDGYTLAQVAMPVYRLPYTTKINWDPVKDLSYVINLAATRSAWWCRPIRRSRPCRTTSPTPRRIPAS